MNACPLTLCMAVYGQPEMLAHNLRTISGYTDEILDNLRVIVVDDCGDPAVTPEFCSEFVGFDLRVFRHTEDKPWNQMGARNLAMHHAFPYWTLMLDPDMVFSSAMIAKVMHVASKAKRRTVIRYGLRHVNELDREIDMTSPNTYLIHREDFLACGGYDEDYAGHKGWSDVQLLDVLRDHFTIEQRKDIFADFYSTNQIPDAAVHRLDRKTAHNKKVRLRKAAEAQAQGGWKRWVKKTKGPNLRTPWVTVYPTT